MPLMSKLRIQGLAQLFTGPTPTSLSTAFIAEEVLLIQQLLSLSSIELSRIRSRNQKKKTQHKSRRQKIPLRKV
jgi:hypothetical protein